MKKIKNFEYSESIKKEYDFSKLTGRVIGKYAKKYNEGTNMILLEPDIAKAFPDDKAVNEALRLVLQLTKTTRKQVTINH